MITTESLNSGFEIFDCGFGVRWRCGRHVFLMVVPKVYAEERGRSAGVGRCGAGWLVAVRRYEEGRERREKRGPGRSPGEFFKMRF